jgi:protein ImuA
MAGKCLQLGFDWEPSALVAALPASSVAAVAERPPNRLPKAKSLKSLRPPSLLLPEEAEQGAEEHGRVPRWGEPSPNYEILPAPEPISLGATHVESLAGAETVGAEAQAVGVETVGHTRASLVRSLQQQIVRTESGGTSDTSLQSTGVAALDRLLPSGGITRGVMVEWLAMLPGGAASYLSLSVASEALRNDRRGGVLLVIDRRGLFYPPAAVALGIPPQRLIVVKPSRDADALWAIDQGLRCSAVTVVWSELNKLDSRGARRLQLAAESQNGLGFLVRPSTALQEPSWADIRWKVQPLAAAKGGRQLQVELLRCRGGRAGAKAMLEIEDGTGRLREMVATKKSDTTAMVNLAAELALIRKKVPQVQKKTG